MSPFVFVSSARFSSTFLNQTMKGPANLGYSFPILSTQVSTSFRVSRMLKPTTCFFVYLHKNIRFTFIWRAIGPKGAAPKTVRGLRQPIFKRFYKVDGFLLGVLFQSFLRCKQLWRRSWHKLGRYLLLWQLSRRL